MNETQEHLTTGISLSVMYLAMSLPAIGQWGLALRVCLTEVKSHKYE